LAVASERMEAYDSLLYGLRSETLAASKAVAKEAYGLNIGLNLTAVGFAAYKGDYNQAGLNGISVATGTYAYFGGPPGWAIAGVWETLKQVVLQKLASPEGYAAVAASAGVFSMGFY
jgi:hypothetical protein